jgi:hypothetical protein
VVDKINEFRRVVNDKSKSVEDRRLVMLAVKERLHRDPAVSHGAAITKKTPGKKA